MGVITLTNAGPDIEKTNYWSTKQAKDGIIYFSVNAGCIRALVPESKKKILQEMKTGKKVILSRGPFPSQGREDAFEILFDDYSDDPFVIYTGVDHHQKCAQAHFSATIHAQARGSENMQCRMLSQCNHSRAGARITV